MKKTLLIFTLFILSLNLNGCAQIEKTSTNNDANIASEFNSNNDATVAEKTPNKMDNFNTKAKAKFADLKKDLPELGEKGIECFEDDCTVVYFNFDTMPYDLEPIIRGNTATLSKLKLQETGVSHVSISAILNGQTVFTCSGSGGKVDECE